MVPTDPVIPPAESADSEFEHPRASTDSSTPKRNSKPPMLRSKSPESGSSKGKPTTASSSIPKGVWPYPPPSEYNRGEPGLFSPEYPDRSLQLSRPCNTADHSHNSHHNQSSSASSSREKPLKTSSVASSSTYPLESMEGEMGADFLGLSLQFGSFAEESPPRPRKAEGDYHLVAAVNKAKSSPIASPSSAYPPPYGYPPLPHPHQHQSHPAYYSKSPPSSYAASMYLYGPPKGRSDAPILPHYPYPTPQGHPMGGYRYYPPPYPPSDSWNSPPAHEAEAPSNAKEAFQTASLRESDLSHPPGFIEGDGHDENQRVDENHSRQEEDKATPEKRKMRSPFRSPPLSQTKKSPMFRSPGLAVYGSFGLMDTPGGTLAAEFSPMGPMVGKDPFGAGYPTPPQLSLSRSNSDGHIHGVTEKDVAISPFAGLGHDFPTFPPPKAAGPAGGLQGVSRSPLLSERRKDTEPRTAAETKILASPMEPASSTKPRKLWNAGSDTSGPMRLELGGPSSLNKSLEELNSRMRSSEQPLPPMATPSTTGSRPGYSQLAPHASYRRLNTPIKLGPSPMQTDKMKTANPTLSSNKRSLPATAKPTRESKLTRTTGGKENLNSTHVGIKRNPCNCKKSRCLKLYCECFANELFCNGCNCTDCQNSELFSSVREKAMKDTRAKNPNAFKPRFSVRGGQGVNIPGASPQSGHNMGCRCKRSECLKKYCECFQAGVMCGSKCKCVDCMNFAGSQKLIDKRRKIKDQRGAELAMKVAEQAWKGPHQNSHHSARKMVVSRPAVHSMRPLPSPLGTPSSQLPTHMPTHSMHMHPSHPSPGHGPHPYMRPGYPSPWGFSPMHASPSTYGMYPPPHHRPHPVALPPSSSFPPPVTQKTTPPSAMKTTREAEMQEVPCAKAVATLSSSLLEKKASNNITTPPVKMEPADEVIDERDNAVDKSPKAQLKEPQPTPSEKPDQSTVQPTPLETKTKLGASALITPSPAARLAYNEPKPKMATPPSLCASQPSVVAFCGDMPKVLKTDAITILSYLPKKDMARVATVNKLWNKLSTELK